MVDAKSMFGNLKSKLGFDSTPAQDHYDEEYDEYDEYGEYDYDDDYYDDADVTTRSARETSMPRLVTMTEARESARTSSYSREGSRGSSVRNFGRTMVDSSLPPSMTPEGTAAVSATSNRRSEGLDSLFSSTARSDAASDEGTSSSSYRNSLGTSSGLNTSSARTGSLFNTSSSLSIPGQRQLQVIRPNKYDDVENVTKVLKMGDVAILSLGNVPEDLMKRLLDFSFGVASALDASVECIGSKVFAITRNEPLDASEREDLRAFEVI